MYLILLIYFYLHFLGRPDVKKGPVTMRSNPIDPYVQRNEIPHRFLSKKCRTALAVPTNFDINKVEKSSKLPMYSCDREYVYGMNVRMYASPYAYSGFMSDSGRISASR